MSLTSNWIVICVQYTNHCTTALSHCTGTGTGHILINSFNF